MTPTKAPLQKKVKRTYVLPSQTLERFETQVPAGQRGAFITLAIERQLEEQRRAVLRARIIEGLNDAENEAHSAEIEREESPLSAELWAQLPGEEWPEPAIIWPQGLKAERQKHGDTLDG